MCSACPDRCEDAWKMCGRKRVEFPKGWLEGSGNTQAASGSEAEPANALRVGVGYQIRDREESRVSTEILLKQSGCWSAIE